MHNMSQNGQAHFKNITGNASRFLKCLWSFWGIMHLKMTQYGCDSRRNDSIEDLMKNSLRFDDAEAATGAVL